MFAVRSAQERFDVLREDINLNVDRTAHRESPEIGLLVGEGNYGEVGLPVMPPRHRQAYTLDRNRAFFSHIAMQLVGNADRKPPALAFGCQRRNVSGAVYMALDKMSAKACPRRQGTLQIQRVARLLLAKGRAPQRFSGKIGAEMGRPTLGHGEAASVHRDAVA